ncbi:hypothetical protein PISMIDRAFT_632210 [Pisolithus microcarpus 441]|uniref:Trafficking protein particle complex subunit 13 n=1 Tax=Pisolithus microcarpus 441 TaxID=765257 RepID=A0A0C9Z7B9_9AGAM|nr:hypothetical protein PISMIDRAFT_632210 [Pisolithus microcarpus 441]
MADFDGQGHLLSLKVMRVSRPGLASAWEPFYSSSSSFSARSTASILSLQGKTPLPGHPKTLRDLSHASEFLTLPAAFGAIQLGETFSSCLCVNNEANTDIEGVNIKVEMQTANSKVLLAEAGGTADRRKLAVGDVLEVVVHHEVKELGQHVLACTVSYRLPPGFRHTPPGPVAEGASDPNLQGFRKYYKFVVTNPLSVKTKVHLPRSPLALLDPVEREKVFLEVHIQNTTQEPMWFERIDFDCAEGWTATDMNQVRSGTNDSAESTPLFSGSVALMQPQATRQYIYVLLPTTIPTFLAPAQPGSVISLGRLDISWRTYFGEPGRLLTAMLTRRIPGPPPPPPIQPSPQQPASAIPPYLQRGGTPSSPRLHSPQLPPSRSASPGPHRPASPFRNRPAVPVPRPQSPAGSIANVAAPAAQSLIGLQHTSDVRVDLVTTRKIQEPVHIYDPFTIEFKLTVSASAPRDIQNQTVSIVVQHLRPSRASGAAEASSVTDSDRELVGGFSASPHTRSTVNVPDRLLVTLPSAQINSGGNLLQPLLPPPHFGIADQTRDAKVKGCTFVGPSSLALEPIKLCTPVQSREDIHPTRIEGSRQFELTFMALQTGYICAGGLRILLIDHELSDTEASVHRVVKEPETLREYDVVGEVWVGS